MVYHLRSGQITELKIILLPRLWRVVTVVASSHGKAVIISELSGCSVICLLVVLVFFYCVVMFLEENIRNYY